MFRHVLVVLLASALAACGGGDPNPSGDGGAADGAVAADSGATADAGRQEEDDAGVVDCFGKANGISCGSGAICLSDRCRSSSCGDGFINTETGEQCEDANEVDGDGCTNCRFDCTTDTDCDDQNPCTENVCNKAAGKQVCESSAVAGNPSCTLATGGTGSCKSGACVSAGCGNSVTDGAEECDDGNTDDTDGCRTDCTFTCKANADCDDGDPCSGTETCELATHTCKTGTAVTCTSRTIGCTGSCDSRTGACRWVDLDKDGVSCDTDCNDADPAVHPGGFECKDGKDNDCNTATDDASAPSCLCYADSDKDGYAVVGAASVTAVTCPDAHTRREPKSGDPSTIDCREGVASAHPGQTTWFDASYCTLYGRDPVTGRITCLRSSFDYNCDSAETRRYTALATTSCKLTLIKGGYICTGSGWVGTTVPACNAGGDYKTCTAKDSLKGWYCSSSTASLAQQCR